MFMYCILLIDVWELELVASTIQQKKKPILLAIPLPTGGRNATKAENLLPFRNIEKYFLSTIANLWVTPRLESCWGSGPINSYMSSKFCQ